MSKHTPGPWEVKQSESKSAFNVVGTQLGGKYKIARCPYAVFYGDDVYNLNQRNKEEAEVNAKLIAAAPELLEALLEIANHITGEAGDAVNMKEIAIDAIKKAGVEL